MRTVAYPGREAVVMACVYGGRKVRLTRFTIDHETGLVRGLDRKGRPETVPLADVGHLHLIRDRSTGKRGFTCSPLRRAHNHEEAPRAHA